MLGIGNKHSGSESSAINLIGSGTTINGDIQSSGDVHIDGTLTGNITLNGRLVIGPNGKIEGNVICQNADISGEIKGKVQIAEMLSLKATAKILGERGKRGCFDSFDKNGPWSFCRIGKKIERARANIGE